MSSIISEKNIGLFLTGLCSCAFLFSWLRSSAQVVEILLFVALIGFYFFNKKSNSLKIDKSDKSVICGMIVVFFAYVVSFFYSQGLTSKLSDLNPYINYLICALIAILLLSSAIKISSKIIFYSIAGAGIFNGLFAFYQAFMLDIGRVWGAIGIFKFSQTSGAICLILASLLLFTKTPKERVLYGLGFVFSFSVVILSVTRGSYVGLFVGFATLIILLLIFGYRKKALTIFVLLIVCMGAWGLKFAFSDNGDPLNVKAFQQDLKFYEKGVVDTSNGLRIEMWKEAMAMFRLSPIFGMRSKLVDQNLEKIIDLSGTKRTFNELLVPEEQNPNPSLYPSRERMIYAIASNRHNQFFDTLASAGIAGILALFFLIGALMVTFWQGSKNPQNHSICLAGFGVLFFFGGCCIGDVPFSSNFMIPFMMITFIILLKLKSQNNAI